MTEPEKAPSPRAKGKWKRRVAWGILALAAVAAIFHRPLLIATIHTAAIQIAARENVELSLDIEGNVLTGLVLKNVHAVPKGHSPVESIDIEMLRVRYDLVRLVRSGLRDFLTGYRLRNAKLVLTPFRGTRNQKDELTNVLRDILQQPALFSDHVQVENFNLRVNTEDGPYILAGVHALLDPVKPGYVRAQEIAVPKIATWHDFHFDATYIDRHFIASDFHLGKEIQVSRLELDGSQREKGINYLSFEGTVLGGKAAFFLWRQELKGGKESFARVTASIGNLRLEALRDFLRWKPELSGNVTQGWLRLAGDPRNPSGWEGDSTLLVENAAVEGFKIDRTVGHLAVRNGLARLKTGELSTGKNRVTIQAERRLPESADQLLTSGLDADLTLDAPDLTAIYPGFSAGALTGKGRVRVKEGELSLSFETGANGVAGQVGGKPFALGSGRSTVRAAYALQRRPPGTPWFDGLHINTDTSLQAASAAGYALDSGAVAVHLKDGMVGVDSAEFHRGPNHFRLSGEGKVPPGVFRWAEAELGARFEIDAPSLAAFVETPKPGTTSDPAPVSLQGSATASGEFRRSGGKTSGHGTVEAKDLVFGDFSARRIALDAPVEENVAKIASFVLEFNEKDKLSGSGAFDLREPYAYEAKISGSVRDLAAFQPLLTTPVGGALEIDWHGSGQIRLLRHSGEWNLALRQGKFGALTGINGDLAGVYSPEKIEFTTFRVRSDQGAVEAGVSLRDERLRVDPLRVEIGKTGLVTGSLSLPLDLRTPTEPQTVFPETGPVEGTLRLREIDLAKLFPPPPKPVAKKRGRPRAPEPVASKAPSILSGIKGVVNASFAAQGTLGAPQLTATLQARKLQTTAAAQVPPASVDLSAAFRDNRLALEGSIAEPGISPLQLKGGMPLVLKKAIDERRIDPATPIAFSAKLPTSSAKVLAQFVPGLRYVEGRMSVDASASGTLAAPVLDGGALLDFTAIRFQSTDAPGIGNFRGDLRFAGNELTFRKFQGEVAGGPFAVTGKVNLERITEPQLDLKFKAANLLLVRNDNVTLRADSDLKIAGPLNTAHVSGKVGITKSRFFREIEILPIGLPGRPAPKPIQQPPNISFETPPLRGWTFDVAVKTNEPFLIRGNLANGQATADLHLGGTGLAPSLEGMVRVESFMASLPFSRLSVDYGYLYFTPGEPFNPTLDIHGNSRIRDYNISVYIYGTAAEPQTLFTSEPPLAQEEIIALLATGATTREITENNQVLASRASVLLLQDLYHKVFKKRTPPPAAAGQQQPLDRFHLDVGTVDPRTGRQEVTGRIQLSKEYEVSAGVDVQGDMQLQLRYLLRFR